jgi:hypothetical protein
VVSAHDRAGVHAQTQTAQLGNERSRATEEGTSSFISHFGGDNDVTGTQRRVESTRHARYSNDTGCQFHEPRKPLPHLGRTHAAALDNGIRGKRAGDRRVLAA